MSVVADSLFIVVTIFLWVFWVCPCFVVQYIKSFLDLQSLAKEERASCLNLPFNVM